MNYYTNATWEGDGTTIKSTNPHINFILFIKENHLILQKIFDKILL